MQSAVAYVRRRVGLRLAIARRLPDAGGRLAGVALALSVACGLAPVGFVVAASYLVGYAPTAVDTGWDSPAGRSLVLALIVACGFFVAAQALSPFVSAVGERVARRVDGGIRDRFAAASATATLAVLEDEAAQQRLLAGTGVLEYEPYTPGRAAAGLIALVNRWSTAVTGALVVAFFVSPLAGAGLLLSGALIRHGTRRGLVVEGELWETSRPREAWYFRRLSLESAAAKELRIFGLADWVRARYEAAATQIWAKTWPVRRRLYLVEMGRYAAIGALLCAVILAWVADRTARGEVPLQDLALVLQAGLLIIGIGDYFLEADPQTEYGMRAHRALQAFEEMVAHPQDPSPSAGRPASAPLHAIRFEGVSFAYPGSNRPALVDLDLEIPAGRSLAVVGLNGAGKTTLVKLLAGLYEPTHGRITVDGLDLRDLAGWRDQIAVIFQDFVRYELSAADNIAVGAIRYGHDLARIRRAAERAGALEIVEHLPAGFDTPLSRRYDGGADLSGGEWQRIALARALIAIDGGASVLVLDEPSANLDVRAESDLFDRFTALTAGVTTILVSHRLSTVRRAHRIVVLDEGRLAEAGTHEQLLARRGIYEHLFRVQAERFAAGDTMLTNDTPDDDPEPA